MVDTAVAPGSSRWPPECGPGGIEAGDAPFTVLPAAARTPVLTREPTGLIGRAGHSGIAITFPDPRRRIDPVNGPRKRQLPVPHEVYGRTRLKVQTGNAASTSDRARFAWS